MYKLQIKKIPVIHSKPIEINTLQHRINHTQK